ncbi:MAG TPA: tetratricopeptide repeat protein, partial [Candidatus Alectryocaccomicrobium excrementavium]|nr:tetratricopeptide repeat protein [Candidatus Alectryocaccomicrobium excrementavium]
ERWFYRAVGEAPYLREPWVNLARFLYQRQDWPGVAYMTHRALQIQTRPGSYINAAEAWGPLPWDLASIALYHLGQYKESARMAQEALRLAPGDERIRENLRLIRAQMEEGAS